MNNHTWIALVAALLLAGCAGTASEFECNATTSDRCMTMEQANDMARNKTEGARGKPGAGALPALVELPAPSVTPLSVPTAVKPHSSVTPAPVSGFVAPASSSAVKAAKTGQQAIFTPATPGSTPLHTEALCTAPRCDSLGEATPLRLTDTIATLWIAPWIDDADVFHQPGRVSFVLTPGTWQLPHQLN